MGVYIKLHILPHHIEPEAWAEAYDEALALLRGWPGGGGAPGGPGPGRVAASDVGRRVKMLLAPADASLKASLDSRSGSPPVRMDIARPGSNRSAALFPALL